MENNHDVIRSAGNFIRKSVTLKVIVIGILILLLLIPAVLIENLIRERLHRHNSVIIEINDKWSSSQTVTGPFITVPFKIYYEDLSGEVRYNTEILHILPETLFIGGTIEPLQLSRSLFKTVVYSSKIKFRGNFSIPSREETNIDPDNILWDKACISLGISDMRGIQDRVNIFLNDVSGEANPGLKTQDLAESGVSAPVKLSLSGGNNSFSFDLDLNGSNMLNFVPVGKSSIVNIRSTWPSPGFGGSFLPDNREIKKDGFSAGWKILHLNRNYPQFWQGSLHNVEGSSFGVSLVLTADIYQKSIRLAKYAVMFLFFTFSAFFFSEIINRQKVHPIQYLLVGGAILIFYTLVLSLSEHMRFNYAYVLSALSVTLIIAGYARAIVKDRRFAAMILGILAILYGYLFIILQLEDYSLLMGSIGLLVIITTVMYMTRKINWYEIEMDKVAESESI